jgi:hypothetical protein
MVPEELIRATIDERKRQVEQIRSERAAEARLGAKSLASRVLGWFHRRGAQHQTNHRRQRRYQAEEQVTHRQSSEIDS